MPIIPSSVTPKSEKRRLVPAAVLILPASTLLAGQDILRNLGQKQDYRSGRVSSYDRTGTTFFSPPRGPATTWAAT